MDSKFKIGRGALIWYHLGAILTIIAWGVSFVSTKVLLDHGLQPTEVYVYRTLLAYLMVLCVCHKRIFSNSLRDELLFVACGLCAGSLYFIAENTALEYTLVSNVSLIVTLAPLLTTLLVGAIYKSEKPGKGVLIGSLIALTGVGFVIFNSSFVLDVKPLGDLLSLAARALMGGIFACVAQAQRLLHGDVYLAQDIFLWNAYRNPVSVHAVDPYAAYGVRTGGCMVQFPFPRTILFDARLYYMGMGQQRSWSHQGKQLPLFPADCDPYRVSPAAW